MEHRCGQRLEIRARTRIDGLQGHSSIARCRDISASGALFMTSLRAPLMSPVQVTFDSGAARRGFVVRATIEGFAVEWDEFSPDLTAASIRAENNADTRSPVIASSRASVGPAIAKQILDRPGAAEG